MSDQNMSPLLAILRLIATALMRIGEKAIESDPPSLEDAAALEAHPNCDEITVFAQYVWDNDLETTLYSLWAHILRERAANRAAVSEPDDRDREFLSALDALDLPRPDAAALNLLNVALEEVVVYNHIPDALACLKQAIEMADYELTGEQSDRS